MNRRVSKIGWIVLAALLCLSLIIVPGCTTPADDNGGNGGPAIPYKNDGMFVQMTIGDPETLDPAASYDTSSGEQISYVYETLLRYKGEGTAEFDPMLATEWEWSDADLTWRFTIREGIKFHEGGDLTPEDVEYSFERGMVYDKLGGPQWMMFEPLFLQYEYAAVTFADVDAAVEVDGNDVVFTLADAGYKLIFLQTIANGWGSIVDKEWCVDNGEWDGTEADAPNHYQVADGATYLWTHMNGTGPWKLNLWDPGLQIKLEKFDGYWGDPVQFDWVITQKVEEWTTRKQALLAGDADLVYVPRMYIGELAGIADLNAIKDLPALQVDAMHFNLVMSPTSPYLGSGALDGNGIPADFFTDTDVRKGFCYAFDYDTYLADAMQGEGILNGSPIVSGLYGYNPDASKYTYDLAKAEEHLKAAWGGQVWDYGFKFTMFYNSGNEVRKVACEILQQSLYDLNPKFEVHIQALDWRTGIMPLIRTHDATVWQIGWLGDYPHAHNFAYPYMHTTGTFSKFQSYGSAELDAKIQAALLEPDPDEQLAKYYELQDIWYDDAPGIVLVQPAGRRFFTKYIHGFYFNTMIPGSPGPLWDMSKSES